MQSRGSLYAIFADVIENTASWLVGRAKVQSPCTAMPTSRRMRLRGRKAASRTKLDMHL